MSPLESLLEKARTTKMTDLQRETQRQSFAYGNAKIENEHITRETIRRESEKLRSQDK